MINSSKSVNWKGPGFWTQSSKSCKKCQKILNHLIKRVKIQYYSLPRVLILIMTSQLSRMMEWFKFKKSNISRTKHDFHGVKEILNFASKANFFGKYHFLAEITLKYLPYLPIFLNYQCFLEARCFPQLLERKIQMKMAGYYP